MALVTGLFKVVDQQCTTAQIHGLLEKHKDLNKKTKEEIRLSGTKPELIQNLQRVVSLSPPLIRKSDVYLLIQNAEENGHQHVYYFKPSPRIRARCRSGSEVATALFGESWGPDYFPQFERSVDGLKWADFRIGLTDKPNDWLAKLYGHERVLKIKHRRREHESATGYREILDWEAEDNNTVLLVRWNSPDLLEIRIDQVGLQKAGTAEERLAAVWERIADALPEAEFTAWDLRGTMTTMLLDRKGNKDLYSLGTVKLLDGAHGDVGFDPYEAKDTIDDDKGRKAAINDLLANNAQGTKLAVTWKPTEDFKDLENPLLSAVTGDEFNCLAVGAQTSDKVMDYVTNKLREFSS